MREFIRPGVIVLFCCALMAQSADGPEVVIADIHQRAKSNNDNMVIVPVRHGQLEIRKATMLNLLSGAFAIDSDKILGGPNWLELDRYDVIAKVPADQALEKQGPLLKALLEQRFKLMAREETRPFPAWALNAGKNPRMKEADGKGESGCKIQTGAGAADDSGPKFFQRNADGSNTVVNLGPGLMVQYSCRNMTMAAFAEGLGSMVGVRLNARFFDQGVRDQTNLQGKWNFDVKWSLPLIGPMANTGERISVADAIDKQLGLKLEEVPVPMKVVVVDSVLRKPTDNPPDIKQVLPDVPAPTEFEVADVKLADPNPGPGLQAFFLDFRMQPGGRFVVKGVPMRFLLGRAFNIANNDQIVGMPSWVDSVRLSITAKVGGDYPGEGPTGMDPEFMAPLLRSLLTERFGLAWHTEQRSSTAYTLAAAKPKLKKADPNSRIYCRNAPPGPNRAASEQMLNCQNATMALFAERLQNIPAINAPVDDATGLDGGWDFNFSYNPIPQMAMMGPGRGGDQAAGPGAPVADDPVGGYTIFESIEKQLGLKLEAKKKIVPVTVIDKLNQKPTEN
jgi:uncharacterized protein (TIGR03435 family)